MVAGNRAEDPLYVPNYRRIKDTVQRDGLLYIGDSKMGALETRAVMADGTDMTSACWHSASIVFCSAT